MNWITNYVRPRINSMLGRREMPENLWIKDPETGEMIFHEELKQNQWVIPGSGFHKKISAKDRLKNFMDNGEYQTPEGRQGEDRAGRRNRLGARHDRRSAGHRDSAGFRVHGRLAGLGRRRGHRQGV